MADENLGGQLRHLRERFAQFGLLPHVGAAGLRFEPFAALGLPVGTDDRTVRRRCQAEGWALWTDNRNLDGPDSLEATLRAEWRPGLLPVLTLGNKDRFDRDPAYVERVAWDVAEGLIDLAGGFAAPVTSRTYVPGPE